LAASALLYAVIAGLHTLQDFDLGWQLATGRWVIQHHQIFSSDVFSHTAQGAPWIYPVLSGIVFYLAYLTGGYALLSWMGALACAATIALLLRGKNSAIAVLALIAVPLIANRTQPRADMFTTILFGAFLSLLWGHYRSGRDTSRAPLWLLPILMVAWVNFHPGFVAGLALCFAYVLCEILDLLFHNDGEAVRTRLRHAWPWLALTIAATSINPWGASVYRAVARQQQAQSLHTLWVVEWEKIRPSWASLHQALEVRDPQSSFWWLLAIAVVCAGIALYRKRWGTAILLLAAAYLTTQHVRLQALFACVTVVVGGSLVEEAWNKTEIHAQSASPPKRNAQWSKSNRATWNLAGLILVTASLTGIAGLRCWDLVTNRYYLRSSQLSLFGTGLSSWYPERAIDFLRREKLPANLFNNYNLGGYLTWRLYPDYLDYIDSRALPFGSKLFFRAYELSTDSPDSQSWKREADAPNLNTIIVSLARYNGLEFFPQLPAFCHSPSWRPVYMDEVSAIFVRRTPQTESLINRLQIDCDKISFTIPGRTEEETKAGKSSRKSAELFNSLSNAAGVLYGLGRNKEALAYLDRAQSIFSDNAGLHLTRALLLDRTGHPAEAESEFRTSLNLEPKDETWLDLGLFYMTQKRYADAVEVFRQSAQASSRPHDFWMLLGQAYLQMAQPQPALQAFDKAVASSPFREGGESLGASFNSMVATGRAKAWYQLGDLPRAVTLQEEAVKLTPDPKLWLGLADLYDAQGHTAQAEQARSHASSR
jgi:Flp pilus assembly protein TadD